MRTLFNFQSQDQTSRLAGAVTVVLAASVGLAVALLVPAPPPAVAPEPIAAAKIEADDSLPESNLNELVAFYSQHVTSQRGFIVFRNGSVVLVAEPCEDPLSKAREILNRCAEPDARFLTERTGDGDVIVTFREAVLHWTPQADIEPLQKWASRNLGSLLSDNEQSKITPDWTPPADARLGLIARKRMLLDAQESKIVKVIRAKQAVAGS